LNIGRGVTPAAGLGRAFPTGKDAVRLETKFCDYCHERRERHYYRCCGAQADCTGAGFKARRARRATGKYGKSRTELIDLLGLDKANIDAHRKILKVKKSSLSPPKANLVSPKAMLGKVFEQDGQAVS
jgi:hypothetical protein